MRGRDYRVEYLGADGTWTSSSKLPYDWQRLTDEDKQKLVDSVKQANQKSQMTSYVAAMIRWVNMYNKSYPPGFKVPEDYRLPNGLSKDWKFPEGLKVPENYIYACAPGVEPTYYPLRPAEAVVTARIMGNRVEQLFDVGVAGLHRLLSRKEQIFSASVLPVSDYHKDKNPQNEQTPKRPPASILALNVWLADLCRKRNFAYLDYFTAMVDQAGFLKADLRA